MRLLPAMLRLSLAALAVPLVACEEEPSEPPVFHTLQLVVSGSGFVRSNPGGIDCPSDCSELYAEGVSVTLRPIALPGGEFVDWGGVCAGGTGSCTLSLSQDERIEATFTN